MRIAGQVKVVSPGDGLQVEVAGEFVVEAKIANVDLGIDGRHGGGTRAFHDEIGASLDGNPCGTKSWKIGEIEVVSRQVEAKRPGGGIVSGAAGGNGIAMEKMKVVENNFALADSERGIELLNGLAEGRGMIDMDLPAAVRIGDGSGSFDEKIGLAGDRIVRSEEGLEFGEVGVTQIGAEVESAVGSEVAVLER